MDERGDRGGETEDEEGTVMDRKTTPDVVVVGSVAFDSVQTPKAAHEKLLGGSASYTSVASALFLGPANLLPCVVAARRPDGMVALEMEGLTIPAKAYGPPPTIGEDMFLCIRPEQVEMSASPLRILAAILPVVTPRS